MRSNEITAADRAMKPGRGDPLSRWSEHPAESADENAEAPHVCEPRRRQRSRLRGSTVDGRDGDLTELTLGVKLPQAYVDTSRIISRRGVAEMLTNWASRVPVALRE